MKNGLSTLNLIFPEVYLEDTDVERRIAAINRTMETYLADGSLEEQRPDLSWSIGKPPKFRRARG